MGQAGRQEGIQMNLFRYFNDVESFTLSEAQDAVLHHYQKDVKVPSIRARIYEGIDKGLFQRVGKGVYTVTKKDAQGKESTCMLVNGDGRDLSFVESNSIDALITDHPYKINKALKGGNRDFAAYNLLQYEQKDFEEKHRILKKGAFLLEFLPEESEANFEYLFQVKKMAIQSGFKYFAKVPWKKGAFVANTGRTQKNREDIVFFSKGEPRTLKLNTMKNKATALEHGLDVKGLDSYGLRDLLEEHNLPVSFMKGTAGMLPTEFDFQPRAKKEKVMEAEKPVELFDAILPYITVPGEKILDQFAGSGNLGVAAVHRGLDAILIEKDEENFVKMKENVERALEEKAVLQADIEAKYRRMEEYDHELRREYEEHGESLITTQLTCENEELEKEIAENGKRIEVLEAEAACYTAVMEAMEPESEKNVITDIFEADTQVIVNPVNLVGVMGAGLAKEMKERYPKVFESYKKVCDRGLFQEGQIQLCKTDKQWILNFPTKRHWKDDSDLALIEKGLQTFVNTYEKKGITSITFPKLGCGLGGLSWDEVGPLMHRYLDPLPIRVEICGDIREVSRQDDMVSKEKSSLAEQISWAARKKEEVGNRLEKKNTKTPKIVL